MDDFLEKIYCGEIAKQCRNGLRAYERMIRSAGSEDVEETLQSLYAVLTAATIISRLLTTPSTTKRFGPPLVKDRGETLSKLLSVQDTSVIHTRSLRDHVEHFDERLDQWAASSPNRIFLTDFIGPANLVVIQGQNGPVHRRYDPVTGTFVFLGDTIDLVAIRSELVRIGSSAESFLH